MHLFSFRPGQNVCAVKPTIRSQLQQLVKPRLERRLSALCLAVRCRLGSGGRVGEGEGDIDEFSRLGHLVWAWRRLQ